MDGEEVKIEEEDEDKPDIVDCGGPVLDEEIIEQFVNRLQRYEVDKLIEHIDEKVITGDFSTKMSIPKVIEEIGKLTIEDATHFNMKRYAVIYNIVDSFGKEELDIFLEIVEIKIESGFDENVDDGDLADAPVVDTADQETILEDLVCCHICSAVFETTECLDLHVEEIHLKSPVVFCCSICDKQFDEKNNLQNHIKEEHLHLPEEFPNKLESKLKEKQLKLPTRKKVYVGSKLKCSECNKTFGNSLTMERHIKRFHSLKNGPKLKCDLCDSEVSDLKNHMKSHEEKKHRCEQCPKKYRTKFDLKTHIKSVHLDVKEPCPHCGKMTANLSKHIYSNHMHEFPCEICGKIFARQNQLNYHLAAHERGTIVEKAPPDVLKEKKKLANLKYLEKRKERKKENKELHEHEKELKRMWARKNRDKLIKYKKEYYEKKTKSCMSMRKN